VQYIVGMSQEKVSSNISESPLRRPILSTSAKE